MKRDTEVVQEIRKMFTINFLDPSAVRILVGAGRRAMIGGEIQRLQGHDSPITARTLTALEVDLKQIQEVKFIRWVLDNWSNHVGLWRPIKYREERM